jgi:hypothetical protein
MLPYAIGTLLTPSQYDQAGMLGYAAIIWQGVDTFFDNRGLINVNIRTPSQYHQAGMLGYSAMIWQGVDTCQYQDSFSVSSGRDAGICCHDLAGGGYMSVSGQGFYSSDVVHLGFICNHAQSTTEGLH